jgi:Ras-related protein Rab-8A
MFEEHQMPDAVKVVVGNKIDLSDREVSKKEGELEASKYSSRYFEVSAKHGKRLDELFNGVIDHICDNMESRGKVSVADQEAKNIGMKAH